MAGRVLRSSNGRFAGSTKGWGKGRKIAGSLKTYANSPSNSRFAHSRKDIYAVRTSGKLGKGKYSVKVRTVTKGERALKTAVYAASVADRSGSVSKLSPGINKLLKNNRRAINKGQYTLARHLSWSQAQKKVRSGYKINKQMYKAKKG